MSESRQLIVFTLDEQRYALHLSAVERTVRMVEITPLPQAPQIVLGVINCQGKVIPALNVRRRFRLPEREPGLGDQLIIARAAGRVVALVADTVSDVVTPPSEVMDAADTILPRMEYVEGVVKFADGMIFIHDLDTFLSLEDEQALDAALEDNA